MILKFLGRVKSIHLCAIQHIKKIQKNIECEYLPNSPQAAEIKLKY